MAGNIAWNKSTSVRHSSWTAAKAGGGGGLHEAERPDCRNQNITAPILSDFDLKASQPGPDRSPQATGFVPDAIVIRLQPNKTQK